MGGGHYDGDIGERARSTNGAVFTYVGYEGGDAEAACRSERRECHQDLNIKGKDRKCCDSGEHPNTTQVVVVTDVTRSRGDDAKIVYGKLPMFIGQIIMKDYVPDPVICFAAVGDASYGDQASIQVGQFESDNLLDENLSKIWLEEGGGGTGQESYELMAYYFARHTILDANDRGEKGYIFFLGDEGFYPKVAKDQIKVWIGDDVSEDIDSRKIFAELQEKYHVFFVYPQKGWEERKDDIDAEIEKRVEEAGGMYHGVDIRASLLWNNRNDLDIHIVDPCGHHIFYGSYCKGNRREPASCGGFLDVDMNVHGETTKPVENIRWPKGKAPKGHYRVYVQNYAFHEQSREGTKFRVEVQIGEKLLHFEGETLRGLSGEESDVAVYEFDFDPHEIETEECADKYAAYDDDLIKSQWAGVIPRENILICEDPRGIVDVMLGALALTGGTVDLNAYLLDMQERGQTDLRIGQTSEALSGLNGNELVKVDAGTLSIEGGGKNRKGEIERL
jgi:hypothetical protein